MGYHFFAWIFWIVKLDEVMSESQILSLKDRIQKKFGSISEFARQTGIDRTSIQILFAVKNPDQKLLALVDRKATVSKVRKPDGLIDPKKLESLKRAINASGGVGAFCRENKGFSRDTVNQVVAGKYKRMSPGVKRLFNHLKIK